MNGVANTLQAVLPQMKQANKGTIITISSIAGRKAFPNHVLYCGTKFGVRGMTLALRSELAKTNLRVCCVCPGVVSTELLNVNDKITIDNYKKWSSNFKALTAEDIANSCKFVFDSPPHMEIREIALGPTG